MLRFLVIDDINCKKDLFEFLKKNKRSVKFLTGQKSPDVLVSFIKGQKRIAVNTTESLTLLNIDEIIRCESNRNYTLIFMENKKKVMVSKTLMDFEQMLGANSFIRIHKSHLVNINYIEKYIKSEGGMIELNDGTKLPVAVRKKEVLLKKLNQL
jgi:two-component system LytT family response regulator